MSAHTHERQQEERPAQEQNRQPGQENEMVPRPVYIREGYKGSGKLQGQTALITGGDSGIGRAAAVHFAREGADVAILYLDEHQDGKETLALVQREGRKALLIPGDVGDPALCRAAVQKTVAEFGRLDVLVNNAAEQHRTQNLEDISQDQLERTFRTNIFGYFYMAQAAVKGLEEKSGRLINISSVTAYKGSPKLIDYASTKGAIIAFTRSLAQSLAPRRIRVNAVAPGPIWTPLIPATFPAEEVRGFGANTLMGRAGQPAEVGGCCVFLASEDSSYMTGQCLHPNGGYFSAS
jgi:NAD(P)-dependent dehydrogenase (short-subunit alcohol dehydrogenase family)